MRDSRRDRRRRQPPERPARDVRTVALAVGALGVVYGDIGTNPLFAMREAFQARHHVGVSEANVFGLLSLVFWSLIVVVTLKYLSFVTRADNDGEGGVLALASMLTDKDPAVRGRRWLFLLVGLFGAALLYGDGMITPAISVLAAVEGTTVAAPGLHVIVIPAAVLILVALFLVQQKGTGRIGSVFGPVMIAWFLTIGVLGAAQVVKRPDVLRAVFPGYAISFFVRNGFTGFLVLGAVILVVVGGEALYADLGHFSRKPILIGWYAVVLPSLVLVYFGQGALLLRDPSAVENPFYRMAPHWALYPLVVLATVATVIASQALISGAYSLTHQAVQLGYSPRVRVRHTSDTQFGQVYISSVNWLLMLACIGLVIGFRHSANLAAAYGVAVTTTMVITTGLFYFVAREHFGWKTSLLVPLCAVFFMVDLAFFSATLFKIPDGGWFPLVAATIVFTVLTTWHTGRRLVQQRLLHGGLPLTRFLESLFHHPPVRTAGACAYLFATPGITPPALLANLRHTKALPELVLVISVLTEKRPRVPSLQRAERVDLGHGFHEIVIHYGFMDIPDVPRALAERAVMGLGCDLDSLSYFVSRESLRVTSRPGMARWREHLFAFMSRNATGAANYFQLPLDRTIEIGIAVEL
ncbi:MAG: potassium transporter Kup [Actinomycetota bacterium]|nr:potassium transporter Kup [Actinomycetota bacterium]